MANSSLKLPVPLGQIILKLTKKLGNKDFIFRLKIARKEAKESKYWLRLLYALNEDDKTLKNLINEAEEIKKILSSIIKKNENDD